MHILDLDTEETRFVIPSEEMSDTDKSSYRTCLSNDMERVECSMSIKGIIIGLGFGILFWIGIIYTILALT